MESRGSLAESTLNIMSLRQYACMSKLALSEISCYKVLSPDASRFACGHIMKWWGVFVCLLSCCLQTLALDLFASNLSLRICHRDRKMIFT